MAIERVFLGWDKPALRAGVEWLLDRFGNGGDLSGVIVTVPGMRAGRRLLELLVGSGRGLVTPPAIVTMGQLVETLVPAGDNVADDFTALLARAISLRDAQPDMVRQVIPHPPAPDDLLQWVDLAAELARLHERLIGEAIRIQQVGPRCANLPDFPEAERWDAIAGLQDEYEQLLASLNLTDPQLARLDAIERRAITDDRHIVLLATADLNRMQRAMIESIGDRVTALIHAPQSMADHFDAFGCLDVAHWSDCELNLDDAMMHVVDQPADQAHEVLARIAEAARLSAEKRAGKSSPLPTGEGRVRGSALALDDRPSPQPSPVGRGSREQGHSAPCVEHQSHTGKGTGLSVDHITVGLGDEGLSPMIERVLELSRLPARSAVGRTTAQSPPATLLAAVAAYLGRLRVDELANLLRHPDMHPRMSRDAASALTVLDDYINEHLACSLREPLPGKPDELEAMGAILQSVDAMLPRDGDRAMPLPHWSPAVISLLMAVYGEHELVRHSPVDQPLVHSLQAIGRILADFAGFDPDNPITPAVTFADALRLILRELAGDQIPNPGGEPAIELLGWLELQLDDAPALIVTGVNEGCIPQSSVADAFLPDRVCRELGLMDNARRFARDKYMLTAIVQSRPFVRLIAGRRSGAGDPLTPSRLLMSCSAERLAPVVRRFLDEHTDASPRLSLLRPGDRSAFVIPPPEPPDKPLDALSVTAFRDYLACPYRFYLKHVQKLESIDDRATEMDGMAFGSLAHDVLQTFGQSDLAASTDAEAIAAMLNAELDQAIRRRYGRRPPVAVRIQQEQLRSRLEAFARWQAGETRAGWRIMTKGIEKSITANMVVDAEPFTLRGRIDRIDVHPSDGYRVLDYKTAEAGDAPEKTHRVGPKNAGEWIDLQLPLYRKLAEGVIGKTDKVALGYILLPKALPDVGHALAEWTDDDLASAFAVAEEVIRLIRRGVFWPPASPPHFDDGLRTICQDLNPERQRLIEEATHG